MQATDNPSGNPAKHIRKEARKKERLERKTRRIDRRKTQLAKISEEQKRLSKQIGFSLCSVQGIVSIALIVVILMFNILPIRFVVSIVFTLLLLVYLPIMAHILAKKKAIFAKVFSSLMIVVLLFGTVTIHRMSTTFANVTNDRGIMLDTIVVAVLESDPAMEITDAIDYDFGVQFTIKGNDIRNAIYAINDEVGSTITEVEKLGINQQAEALFAGDVQAIIYNDAFTGVLEDSFKGFRANTRIIFEYQIVRESNVASATDVELSEPFAMFIAGVDEWGVLEDTGRNDVNIIMIVNPNTHQILLVSTPRDYWVPIPDISNGNNDKLTHAGVYGMNAAIRTLEELYDTEIPFFVQVNFTSFEYIIDALGGIDVYSEIAFTTSHWTGHNIPIQQGYNHLSGQEALAFTRERKVIAGGDLQRGRNQQAVITAMVQRAMSPAILTGANQVLNAIADNMNTNMEMSQIQDLIRMQLDQGIEWDIISMDADGTFSDEYCFSVPGVRLAVVVPDESSVKSIQEAIRMILDNQIIAGDHLDGTDD